jgi:hypothetical protein
MKFGMKCRVASNTEIGKECIQVTLDGTDFTLEPSEEGLLSGLTVVTRIPQGTDFISQIAPSNYPGVAGALSVDVDKQFIDELKELIQYIESMLSFHFQVKKVYLEEAKRFFVPENEDEMEKIDVISYSVQKQPYPEQIMRLTVGDFKDIIHQRGKYEPLTMVRMFQREGLREFSSFRYIQAFYNFYFVLEDLYAQGKTNNSEVGKRFKSNQTLRDIVQKMLNTAIKGHHLKNIQNFLNEEKMKFDIDGILDLIVQVRGNLHHYSSRSTKRKGTPFNQGDFESMAFLLMGLAQFSIIEATFK